MQMKNASYASSDPRLAGTYFAYSISNAGICHPKMYSNNKNRLMSIIAYAMLIVASALFLMPAAADTTAVEIYLFSGVPNPVYVLRDSTNVAPIKRRVGHYEILAALSWPGCPEPRSGLGYRGVKTGTSYGGPQGYALASGGSLKLCPQGASCRSYCDYRLELERMALRACMREHLIPPSIQSSIPDSLLRPVCHDGMFTLQQDASETIADFSLMRRYQTVPWEDTVLDQDITVTSGGGGWSLTASFGIIDKGQQTGFTPVVATALSPSAADSIAASYGKRFDELTIAIPAQGYVHSVSVNPTGAGHLYIVKTSEGGYCALMLAGYYIGGIDRLHFYYRYTSENTFSDATTIFAAGHRGPPIARDAKGRQTATVDLLGRSIQSNRNTTKTQCSIATGKIETYDRRSRSIRRQHYR